MYQFLRQFLFRMDPEAAHTFTLKALSSMPSVARLMTGQHAVPENLSQTIWNHHFPHPIGLAAGLDKNAEAVNAFLQMGFSFIEVGTVTPKPQPGNPQPRLFRLVEDDALINRMGFNNEGAQQLQRRLTARTVNGFVGINIGKNKVTPNDEATSDYVQLVRNLYALADFFVINVSSPNTPGLRDLQAADSLVPLVQAVLEERALQAAQRSGNDHHAHTSQVKVPPVLVKLAPDLDDASLIEIAKKLSHLKVDGFIATNTTIARPQLSSGHRSEQGGLSGRPLKERATEVLSLVYQACDGRVPVIASGGVFTAQDAYEKIRAGASLVELYTAFIYKGPMVIHEIVEGISKLLTADGFESITEAIGADHH